MMPVRESMVLICDFRVTSFQIAPLFLFPPHHFMFPLRTDEFSY